MSRSIADRCLELLNQAPSVRTLDLTGGAPELTPQFRHLVESASKIDHVEEIIDRCNLTVLLEPGQEDLAEFLAKHKVKIVASLPCYTPETVNKQRGGGVFGRSITALQQLNSLGYGQPGTGLVLDLVYNPSGIFLAPSQASLTETYRAELKEGYNIVFNNLYALNNMPIKRWADYLIKEGRLEEYMGLLVGSFNPGAAEGGLMCRETLSVGWDGRVYDCDFNQQLELGLLGGGENNNGGTSVFDLDSLDDVVGKGIVTDNHCFGCTAGAGSSCTGAAL
jgi:radical SAM/Cys-rich protein